MKRNSPFQWFNDTPIARKLYFTVGIMAVLIMVELAALFFSIQTISSVRAFVGAESVWSKAQKDALWQLIKYAQSRNETDYGQFMKCMKVTQGVHNGLVEMAKQKPDVQWAMRRFIDGGSHPDDVTGMVNLFRRFHSNRYIQRAMAAWALADGMVTASISMGERLHTEIQLSNGPGDVGKILLQIAPLNEELTVYENEFSFALSEGSRWLEKVVLKLLFLIVLTVETTGLLLAITLSRGIQRGLADIMLSAQCVAKGNFDRKARVYSRDEIGMLANAFNKMADDLKDSAEENELALRECLKLLGIHGDKIKEKLGRTHPGAGGQ